jgi:hypothetical protein
MLPTTDLWHSQSREHGQAGGVAHVRARARETPKSRLSRAAGSVLRNSAPDRLRAGGDP